MRWPGWRNFFRRLSRSWKEDDLGETAAALSYYGILSLFPFLLFIAALAGLVLKPSAVAAVVGDAGKLAPGAVTQIVEDRLRSLQQRSSSGLLTLGFVGAFWIASGAINALMRGLNRCYGVRETRPFWRVRGTALLMTLVAGIFALLAVAVMFAVPAAGAWIGGSAGGAITWLRFPVAAGIMILFWAVLYRFLPNVRPKFQLISPGSVAGVMVWLLASWGFSEYVRHFGRYDAIYGALGGVIILLVWMWLSSSVVLLGAEVNVILAGERTGRAAAPGAPPREPAGPRRGGPREPEPSPG